MHVWSPVWTVGIKNGLNQFHSTTAFVCVLRKSSLLNKTIFAKLKCQKLKIDPNFVAI